MTENLPVRLATTANSIDYFFARLANAAWAIPAVDPMANNDQNIFSGRVGRLGASGFKEEFGQQEIAFFAGCCSGVFYREDIVRVIRWPFKKGGYPGHDFKWLAVGTGCIAVWATKDGGGGKWLVDVGQSIGGGPVPPHHIIDQQGPEPIGTQDSFPGVMAPLARTAVTLTDKPVQFKWCGAEGVFYPVVQTPGA